MFFVWGCNMNTIDRLRQPPILIGGIVAGLLLLAVVGVVRNAGGAPVASAIQSNAAAAVVRPAAPTAVILPIGATKIDPNDGTPWVWLGAVWLSCRHLDTLGLTYHANANDQALLTWQRMTIDEKQEIAGRCK